MSRTRLLFGGCVRQFCALLLSLLAVSVSAQDTDHAASEAIASRQALLQEEAADIAKQEQELARWRVQETNRSAALMTREINQVEVDRAALAAESAKVALESIQLDITAAEQQSKELDDTIQSLHERIQVLSALPEAERDKVLLDKTKALLEEKQRLLELELEHAEQLAKRKKLAQQQVILTEQWRKELKKAYENQAEKARQASLEELEKELAAKRRDWQDKVIELRNRLGQLKDDPDASQAELDLAQMQLFEAEESIFLLRAQLKLAQINISLDKLATVSAGLPDELNALKSRSMELEHLQDQLVSLSELLQSKLKLLQQLKEVIDKRSGLATGQRQEHRQLEKIHARLSKEFNQQAQRITDLREALESRAEMIEAAYLEQKKRGLTARHRLPANSVEWKSLLDELSSVPGEALQIGRNTLLSLWAAIHQAEAGTWSLLIILAALWMAVFKALGRLATQALQERQPSFTQKAMLVSIDLLRSTRYDLLIGGLLVIAAWGLGIVPPGLSVISTLVGIWLGLRVTLKLSRWILDSPIGLSKRQPGLHRFIIVYAALIALAALILILAHLDLFSLSLRELLDRVFMLLLIPPAFLSLRIRRLLMEHLQERRQGANWVRLLGLASFAVPLAIMSAAVLGIIGYVNLAWYVAGYLVIVIGILMTWLIIRGLVIDLAHYIQVLVERRSQHSAFWVKSLVEPIHFTIRLVLLLTMVWFIYRVFIGDPTTGFDLRGWLKQPLFTLGETSVNSLALLGTLLLLILVFYIGRWAREVTYNWLYAKIRDLGVRNSLSVFTQYAVVVIGLLIALNVIGINLTSLTVFAGALGVGIGFGLQNIANNFISGLILLAERPVRTKDWVTIGDKEGVVSQIGMRSVTVTTWDNQDVIIPNSDLISNSFTNWTRTNNVVRTVLAIGIHYDSDPHKAQAVIEETVTMQPEVLLNPPPRVWLHEFGNSSVDFRVYYYMDVNQFGRLDVKSKVLFAIWDALKDAGITIPFPQQDLHIKTWPRAVSPIVPSP